MWENRWWPPGPKDPDLLRRARAQRQNPFAACPNLCLSRIDLPFRQRAAPLFGCRLVPGRNALQSIHVEDGARCICEPMVSFATSGRKPSG